MVSSPSAANVRYASPRAPGSANAWCTVHSVCEGTRTASAPAGRSAAAAAPRPVLGKRAGTIETRTEVSEVSAPAPEVDAAGPPARVQAIMASPTPASSGDAAPTAPASSPEGGASAVSHSARATGSTAAAASPASVRSSRTSAHAAVSFRGESATRSRSPLTGGVIAHAAHPAAGGPKYTSRSSRLATRAHARSRVAASGDANATTGGCNPHSRRMPSRNPVCSSCGIGTPMEYSMATGGEPTPRPLEWRRTNAPGDVLGKQTSSRPGKNDSSGEAWKKRRQNGKSALRNPLRGYSPRAAARASLAQTS